MEESGRRAGITTDMVLKELSAIAFANIGDYLDWGRGPTKRELALYKVVSEMALLLCLRERRQRERRSKT